MQIVIDIDEESYEHIKKYANEEVLPVGWYAIINGTPLSEWLKELKTYCQTKASNGNLLKMHLKRQHLNTASRKLELL